MIYSALFAQTSGLCLRKILLRAKASLYNIKSVSLPSFKPK
ncbi:hypothetical protein T11_13246 [Trichinella zimbabwensis]|uniref:Uncharacterized protein n=1 Tax=Trichinella zimbabwensis TaxID=268475 RepID=A0A0V1FNZ2_9BILA|nr:hypothetical protein T11_13246 [Trichinella zimbabwensis]